MKAREGVMASVKFGDKLKELYPVVEADLSDSGSLDCCVEFLMQVRPVLVLFVFIIGSYVNHHVIF